MTVTPTMVKNKNTSHMVKLTQTNLALSKNMNGPPVKAQQLTSNPNVFQDKIVALMQQV
jgi:hypothetical protein